MTETPDSRRPASQAGELEERYVALRQAARSRAADPGNLLEAVFTELEGAIELLRAADEAPAQEVEKGSAGRQHLAESAERALLRAAFQDAPVPLFMLSRDGTVQRVNKAAGDLIGARPGYATGRPFTTFVDLPSRAAVTSQLTAVSRNGRLRRLRCSLLGTDGLIPGELVIGRVALRGESDPLLVAVRGTGDQLEEAQDRPARAPARDGKTPARGKPAIPAEGPAKDPAAVGAVQAITRRLDLVTEVARLLLENEGFSEVRALQRSGRLIAAELNTWVIVDTERRHRIRRQFAVGPDDPAYTQLTSVIAAMDPGPESLFAAVHEAGHSTLIAHVEDAGLLGDGPDGVPLLIMLDATSVLSVPLTDGENRYGVLTLVRRASDGPFVMADLALVEELGRQMALAIRVDRQFRRRSDTADALHASLLLRKMPEIPGLEIAATYLAAGGDPEVGGDFYDVYRTPDGWGLAVGDVCGKGEEAAAATAAARYAVRVLARRAADPGEVLAGANEVLLADELALDGGFVTANLVHLSWQDGTLRAVVGSAGHPAAALLRADGAVRLLAGGGLPLGLFPDAESATQELTLERGDSLFLYTDGVAQARGHQNTYFQDRLTDELTGLAGSVPGALVAAMRRAMIDFSAGELVDDVTMLVVRAGQHPPAGGRSTAAPVSTPAAQPSPSRG